MEDPAVRAHFVEEMADVLMFYSDILLCFDIPTEDLKRAYTEIFQRNMNRWWNLDVYEHIVEIRVRQSWTWTGRKTMNLKAVQQEIYQNKVDKHWNISNIETELCLMQGEIAEFYEAYRKHLPSIGEELADVAIYLLGIAEILHLDLEKEIEGKMRVNRRRQYTQIDGVSTRISE